MSGAIETFSEHVCFGGVQGFHRHASMACAAPMRFALYRPPQAAHGRVPAVFFLAGLTCSEETATIKAGAQRVASALGLALVMPDTSPRDTGIPGEADDAEAGAAASFYLDATVAPWSRHYRMRTWLVEELPALLAAHFPIDPERLGICGHSMGGHGALTLALRHPDRWRTLSAIAPVVAPTQVPWGRKALPRFLGDDPAAWAAHDACALVAHRRFPGPIRIDQGLADRFLDTQLRPELFEAACAAAGQPLAVHRHPGYDHGYYFVATVIEAQLRHQAAGLSA